MVENGSIFYTTSDTETIVKLIARSKRSSTIDKIVDTLFQIQGGYALVMIAQNTLIGVRGSLRYKTFSNRKIEKFICFYV